jgi:hypothetical protein
MTRGELDVGYNVLSSARPTDRLFPGVTMTRFAVGAVLLVAALISTAQQPVQLPYVFRDEFGSNWDVQYDGSIGDAGNDLYDGGGRLFINNQAQFQAPNGQATLDPARNEVAFAPMMVGAGVQVSRRVGHLPAIGAIRFVEVVENTTGSTARVQLRCYFNMGSSVQQAIPLADERRPKLGPVGYAIWDQRNAVAMIGAGRAATSRS